VVIPDTQKYSQNGDSTRFNAMMNWIVANQSSKSIMFVAGLGDIVEHNNNTGEFQVAQNAWNILDNNGSPLVPYSVIAGNHDFYQNGTSDTNYNTYFPYTRFTGYYWYGGNYPSNSYDNSYQLISVYGNDYLILNIATGPVYYNKGVEQWANGILNQYSSRQAIFITHGYIDTTGALNDSSDTSGIEVWNNIVKLHSNVIMVCCGHAYSDNTVAGGEYNNIQIGVSGNIVQQLLSDYQCTPNNGNGWLRYYTITPSTGTVQAFTFSPTLNQYDTDPKSQFTFTIPIQNWDYP